MHVAGEIIVSAPYSDYFAQNQAICYGFMRPTEHPAECLLGYTHQTGGLFLGKPDVIYQLNRLKFLKFKLNFIRPAGLPPGAKMHNLWLAPDFSWFYRTAAGFNHRIFYG